jgi:hypothetical protein
VAEHSPGHKPWRRRIVMVAALATFALVLVGSTSTGAKPLSSGTARAAKAKPPAAKALIRPAHGNPYVPTLGDWEGKVNGFPASFALLSVPKFHQLGRPPYGFTDVVALRPASCPPSSVRYSEETITGGRPAMVRRGGSFTLERFGFSGGLRGASSAVVMSSYTSSGGRCSGRLVWQMHPAKRARVLDGTWRAHFSDGESSTFDVQAGGRLATRIALPSRLHGCGGPTGALDLFIGARGNAAINQAKLSVGVHFAERTATGNLSVPGASCRHPSLTMTASR